MSCTLAVVSVDVVRAVVTPAALQFQLVLFQGLRVGYCRQRLSCLGMLAHCSQDLAVRRQVEPQDAAKQVPWLEVRSQPGRQCRLPAATCAGQGDTAVAFTEMLEGTMQFHLPSYKRPRGEVALVDRQRHCFVEEAQPADIKKV
jgi:hypothetical protein